MDDIFNDGPRIAMTKYQTMTRIPKNWGSMDCGNDNDINTAI